MTLMRLFGVLVNQDKFSLRHFILSHLHYSKLLYMRGTKSGLLGTIHMHSIYYVLKLIQYYSWSRMIGGKN